MKLFKNTTLKLLAIALIFVAASCSRTDKTLNYIPEDAIGVAVFDLKSMLVRLKAFENTNEFQDLKKEMENEQSGIFELLKKVIRDPNNSGLLLRNNIYAFAIPQTREPLFVGLIGLNKQTFEDNLELVGTELFGINPVNLFMSRDGIKYFEVDRRTVLAYNDDVMLVLSNPLRQGNLEKAMSILKKEHENSILSNSDFKEFFMNCKDFNLWVSSNASQYVKEAKNIASDLERITGIDYKNNYGHFHVELADNEVILTQKLRYNKSVANIDVETILNNVDELMHTFEKHTKGKPNIFEEDEIIEEEVVTDIYK